MIQVKKKSHTKLLLILTAVMAVLIAGYFVLVSLLPENTQTTPPPTYDQLEWEGTSQRVFPDIDTSLVGYITVNATKGSEHASYGLTKTEDGTFAIWYETEKGSGEYREYRPDIVEADPSFKYSSLYAMDSFGQGQVARFFYLRSAITTMYFTERISLEGLTEDEKRSYLEEFGFMDYGDYDDPDDNKELGVIVNYGSTDVMTGENKDFHAIWIGGKNVSENGYYVMLDNHSYIYATNNSNIGYAVQPYTYYINPSVISAGLSVDAAYEPYLISDYRQWKNTFISTPGTAINSDANVTVQVETTLPANHDKGGLITEPSALLSFHLGNLSGQAAYARLIRLLSAQTLTGILNEGKDSESMPALADPLYLTLVTEGLALSFPEDQTSMTYTYKITKILSALTADGETLSGIVPENATDLRVAYDLYIGDATAPVNKESLHAVLSLSDARIAAYKDALYSAIIGENVNIDLHILHDMQSEVTQAHKREIKLYVADIIAIYDKNGKTMTAITEESTVAYRYYLEINGVKQDSYLTAADKVANMDDANKELFLAIGKVGNGYNQQIGAYTEYLDIMKDYISYKITAIPYMVVREEIVHFAFQNFSDRDPFYGESIYENLMEDKRGLYGLNNTACQNVLLHLGGAGGSTTASNGYAGDEAVAVGLTPENMRKYGLYAHTIYYELPRIINGIQDDGLTSEEVMEDYTWQNTLGFTVYISDKQPDGSRYIASDLYDVVVRVVDEKLDFVEYSFVDFWARRLLVGTDIDDLAEVGIEFNFEELKGRFDFILDHIESYNPHTQQMMDLIQMKVRPGADTYENLLVSFMKENGRVPNGTEIQTLVSFYNKLGPEKYLTTNSAGNKISVVDEDYSGTYFFKQTLGIMYTTMYLDTYTAEEQAEILASAPMLARITFKLEEREHSYVYEFYRASDRRVLVKIYQANAAGVATTDAVSDFSISTATFKKIVGAFDALLNAREVLGDEPYFDISAKNP